MAITAVSAGSADRFSELDGFAPKYRYGVEQARCEARLVSHRDRQSSDDTALTINPPGPYTVDDPAMG
jgi:hypothetical protein